MKIMKLLSLLLLLALPVVAQAQFTFTTNSGAITITAYTGSGGAVTIPATTNGYPVTSIGDNAFGDVFSLTSVTIPNSVTNIGGGAFFYCSSLTSVTIPNSVTSIGEEAFSFCDSLTNITVTAGNPDYSSVNGVLFDQAQATLIQYPGGLGGNYTIPNGVTSIGYAAFESCASLTSVTIPQSVTSIGVATFFECTSLTNITVVAGNPDYSSINGVLFDQAQATLIECPGGLSGGYTIPNSVTNIGAEAFAYCTVLTSVTIPNNVTGIGVEAFYACYRLTSVTIPNSVISIGTEAFYHSGLADVIVPSSVTSIGEQAFFMCYDLTNITVVAGNPDYGSINGVLFDQAQATLIQYPGGLHGGYIIPNGVTNIGADAFSYCNGLTGVAIPNSVTRIGVDAFNACFSLTSVTIPGSVTSIGDYAFAGCPITSAYFLGNAPPDDGTVFADDPATVYYLAGTTGWGSTFGGVPAVALTSQTQFTFTTNSGAITITGYIGPGGAVFIPPMINGYPVTSIGGDAFFNCTNLTSVTIPNSVTSIGLNEFADCTSLTNITVVAGDPDYSSVNGVLFDQAQATLIEYPGGLGGGYTFPNSVTTIGEVAFYDCTNLTSVTIPNGITRIGYEAFADCPSLTNITVVAGNPNYSSVNGVLFDQAQATLIQYPAGLDGGYTVPNSVTTIGETAFAYCTGLTSVTIPNSVTSISDSAFFGCTNLTSVYFLGNAPTYDGPVFIDDSSTLSVYYLPGTAGWFSTFSDVPAVLWNPQAQVPGVTAGQFGFGITGPTNATIVVEACTNLANPVWLPVATNTLSGTGIGTFSDPQTGSYPARYYRFSAP